jgi:hypothetical protein
MQKILFLQSVKNGTLSVSDKSKFTYKAHL